MICVLTAFPFPNPIHNTCRKNKRARLPGARARARARARVLFAFSFRRRLRPPPADVSGRRFRTVSPAAEARRTSSGATTGSPRSSWRRASGPRRATGWLRPRGGRGGSLGSAGRGGMERAWEWTQACSDFWVALAFGKPHSRLSLFHSYGWCPRRGIPRPVHWLGHSRSTSKKMLLWVLKGGLHLAGWLPLA